MIINGRLNGISEWDVAVRSADRKARHLGSDEDHAHHARQLLRSGHSPEHIMQPHLDNAHHAQSELDSEVHKWQRAVNPRMDYPSVPDLDKARPGSSLKSAHDHNEAMKHRAHSVARAIGHHAGMFVQRHKYTPGVARFATHQAHINDVAKLHRGKGLGLGAIQDPSYPKFREHRSGARFPSREHAHSFIAAVNHHYPHRPFAYDTSLGHHDVRWPSRHESDEK